MMRSIALLVALGALAGSCTDDTGPDCENPFTGTLNSSDIPDAGLWGCAKFYKEFGTNRWIIELREEGTTGEWLNVIYNSPTSPTAGTFTIPSSQFVVTVSVQTATNGRSFTATSGTLVISEAAEHLKGTLSLAAKETTQGSPGTATISVAAKFVAICTASQFQSC